jgi:hypothetical protein
MEVCTGPGLMVMTRTPCGMETAAKSLKKQGKCALGGPVDVVGAAASISGDRGDGGYAAGAAAFQIGCEESQEWRWR